VVPCLAWLLTVPSASPLEGLHMDVYGHPFRAPEEALLLGLGEGLLQAGREDLHQVLGACIPEPSVDHVGAGGIPAPVLEDRDGGLDGPLGHGCEEYHVQYSVSRLFCVGYCLQAGALHESFLDKPISLLVRVPHEAVASQGRLSLLGLAFPGYFMLITK